MRRQGHNIMRARRRYELCTQSCGSSTTNLPPAPLVPLQDGTLQSSGRMAAGFMAGITEALMIVTPFEVGAAGYPARLSPVCSPVVGPAWQALQRRP